MIRYEIKKDNEMEVFLDDKNEFVAFKTWSKDDYTYLDITEVESLITVLLSFKDRIETKRRLEKEFNDETKRD